MAKQKPATPPVETNETWPGGFQMYPERKRDAVKPAPPAPAADAPKDDSHG